MSGLAGQFSNNNYSVVCIGDHHDNRHQGNQITDIKYTHPAGHTCWSHLLVTPAGPACYIYSPWEYAICRERCVKKLSLPYCACAFLESFPW